MPGTIGWKLWWLGVPGIETAVMKPTKLYTSLFPVLLFAAGALALWLSPAEAQLGAGVKYVYVHATLIWAGMAGLALAGLAGIVIAVNGRLTWAAWTQTLTWIALAFYAAGLSMSMLAAEVNWGGMFWQEPRTRTALQVLTLALIVQVLGSWHIWHRLVGALRAGLVLFLAWTSLATPLFLHPPNAIRNSTSTAIQLSTLLLFGLWCLLGAWIMWRWQTVYRPASP